MTSGLKVGRGSRNRPNGRPNYFLGKYVKYALFETIYDFERHLWGESPKPDDINFNIYIHFDFSKNIWS